MAQKIGIYSGTFDPIHKGHISFALEAAKMCKLDKVVFLPEHSPRGKQNVTPLAQRLEQVEQAIVSHPQLEARQLEAERFTYMNTLPELQMIFPDATFSLLMGSDVAKTLVYGWQYAEKLFAECEIIIGLRGGDSQKAVEQALGEFRQIHEVNIAYCETAYYNESSTLLRQRSLISLADS